MLVLLLIVTSVLAGVDDDDDLIGDQRGLNPPRPMARTRMVSAAGDVARKANVTGLVGLEYEVTREGTTENIRIVRPLDDRVDFAVVEDVRKLRYEPATKLNGLPVRYKVKAEWHFGPWR